MKHALAVAFISGFADALAQGVQDGEIDFGYAAQATKFALAIAKERLKGERVLGKKLEDFSQDGERIQSILEGEKVNLQKWGD